MANLMASKTAKLSKMSAGSSSPVPRAAARPQRRAASVKASLAPSGKPQSNARDVSASAVAVTEKVKTEVQEETLEQIHEASPVPQEAPNSKRQGYKDAVLLQGFGWDSCQKGNWYDQVKAKIPDFKAAGITHLWLPPPSQSVAPQGYLPGQLYNLNSKYGNEQQLKALIQELKAADISPIADIVINHRCADEKGPDGKYNNFRDDVDHNGKKVDWDAWAITAGDGFNGTGAPDTGADYGPAPDLDHTNEALRGALVDWLQWLQNDIGFEGWRLDYTKGYGARFVTEYMRKTVGGDVLNVGEYWTDLRWNGGELDYNQNDARQTIMNWIKDAEETCCSFDFPTKGILQEAVKNCQYWRLRDPDNRASGCIGWWPSKIVTFIDNHDTGSTQQHWPFPADRVGLGYAYILTHPGVPCVFWDHMVTWGDDVKNTIKNLIAIRKRNNIVSDSKLEILCGDHDMYVAKINDRVIVKLGPRHDMGGLLPKQSEGWKSVAHGTDFAVWERAQ